ncbi:TPA: discoidin domain-containing protein, partial [Streptococcus suis]
MNRQDKNYQKLYHYSIRKRNWGVGSVVVGVFLASLFQGGSLVHANTDTPPIDSASMLETRDNSGTGDLSNGQPQDNINEGNASANEPNTTGTSTRTAVDEASSGTPRSVEANNASGTVVDPTTFGEKVAVPVSTHEIRLSGDTAAFHATRTAAKLSDGDTLDHNHSTDDQLAELAYSGQRLPKAIEFTFTNPSELDKMLIYKRVNLNGTLKSYKVEAFQQGVEAAVGTVTVVDPFPSDGEIEYFDLSSYGVLSKVKLTFLEAVNGTGGPQNNLLTVKEVQFLKKSDIRGEQVDSSSLVVTGATADYQANRGLDKLTDGKISSLTETKWGGSQSSRQTLTVSTANNEPLELTGLTLFKRPGNNGSVTKYTVRTLLNDAVVQEIPDIVLDVAASVSNVALNGSSVNKVQLVIQEARDSNGQVSANNMTLRELKLYKKSSTEATSLPPTETNQPTLINPQDVRVAVDKRYAISTSHDAGEGGAVPLKAVDDDARTYWTSNPNQHNSESNPQYLQVRLLEEANVKGVIYTPRFRTENDINTTGNVRTGKIWYSADGVNWEVATPVAVKLAKGDGSSDVPTRGSVNADTKIFTLSDTVAERNDPRYIEIQPVNARYIRLQGIETRHWSEESRGKNVTAAALIPVGTKRVDLVAVDPNSAVTTSHHPNDSGIARVGRFAVDGDPTTFWSSSDLVNNNTDRQTLTVSLTAKALVKTIELTPRQDNSAADYSTGDIKRAYIEYKVGDEWRRVIPVGASENGEFTLAQTIDTKVIAITPVEAKEFRLTVLQSHHWNNEKLNNEVAIAEFRPVGERLPAIVQPVNFSFTGGRESDRQESLNLSGQPEQLLSESDRNQLTQIITARIAEGYDSSVPTSEIASWTYTTDARTIAFTARTATLTA